MCRFEDSVRYGARSQPSLSSPWGDFLWGNFGPATASAAYRELDRLIVQAVRAKDKTYRIIVEDVSTPSRNRDCLVCKRPIDLRSPSLDQAILHVRQGNQFVLIRNSDDGSPFITGSNGKESWAVKSRGPIELAQTFITLAGISLDTKVRYL